MLLFKAALGKRAGDLAPWRKKRVGPESSRTSAYGKVTKRFRRGHVTKLRANINTTAGRLILFLFWVLFVWVLLFRFLGSNSFDNLFANAALVFPIEFFVLKVIVGVVIALSILNPLGLFSVNVPAWTALLMSDRLTYRLHVFGPGRHIKLPWEVAVDFPVRLELTN